MTNIGINYGTYLAQNSQEIEDGQKIFGYRKFAIYKNCKGIKNYFLEKIDIEDDPNIKNMNVISDLYEGVFFMNEEYTDKKITAKIYLFETKYKSYDDLVAEIKDAFEIIRGDLEFYYRGELMKVNVIKTSLKFDFDSEFKSFELQFIAKPFLTSQIVQNLAGTINGTNGILKINNKGNRIYPLLNLTIHGNCGGLAVGNSTGKVRFIRDTIYGDRAHFVELKAIEKFSGKNVALNKEVSGLLPERSSNPYSRFTDGNIDTNRYCDAGKGGKNSLTVDLGGIYNLEKIQVWHYYKDRRICPESKVEVSINGRNWETIFDCEEEGTYIETPEGRTYYLEERLENIAGKRIIEDELNDGDRLKLDFETGKIFKNGAITKTNGTFPLLGKNSELYFTAFDKIIKPNYDTKVSSLEGLSGNHEEQITEGSDYETFGHYFKNHGIKYLKDIKIIGEKDFNYTVKIYLNIYTDTSKNTKITSLSQTLYGGEYTENPIFTFENEGLNISSYTNIFVELSMSPRGLTSSSDIFFRLITSYGNTTGNSYDEDMNTAPFNFNIELYGLDTEYTTTSENISSIDYNLSYKNNYL